MICDLVGSTALSARLDPEDMGAVIDAFQAACARITLASDGFLADFRGDGILAYFGYPRAHEDDAERTVRAGLDIVAAVARLKTPAVEPLAVRIGIATGLVVVAVARAHCGSMLWSGTRRTLQPVFSPWPILERSSSPPPHAGCLAIGSVSATLACTKFKGIAEPIAAWAVDGVSASESRFEAVHAAGLTDLIGREDEIDFLLERQGLAWKGEGQIVLISGEAGIGKSRLVAAFEERIAGEPHTLLRYQCSPHHTNSALYPIIEQLERAAGFKADDTSEQRLDKLEALLAIAAAQVRGHSAAFCCVVVDPVWRPISRTGLEPRTATPPHVSGAA